MEQELSRGYVMFARTTRGFSLAGAIALIRDDVTKISLNVEPRLGGDHFAWFVDV